MIGKDNFLTRLIHLPIKISIRLSILGIVLTLLLGVSALIVGINYYVLDSVLITAANGYLSYASGKISEQISGYFKPLNDNASTAFHMFNNGIVEPEYSDKFIKFLYSLINDDENISGAFWGDTSGNLCWLNKVDNGNFLEQSILHDSKIIEKLFDPQGKLLSVKELPFNGIDPRIRPWYQQAKLKKQLIWVVYKFLKAGSQEEPLGVTAAFPFYDATGNLLGVFGVDMLVESISKYIHGIKVTENSSTFVVDEDDNLISVLDTDKNLLKGKKLPKIEDLKKPWLKKSFTIYHQNHKSPFIYSSGNKQYIFSYEKIANLKNHYLKIVGSVFS